MRKPIIAALSLAAIAAAGCATSYAPRYQRASDSRDVGYYDQRVSDNRYVVQYRADGNDPRLAEDFAMRRAAEVTLESKYDWFQIINRSRAMSDTAFGRYDGSRYYANEYESRPTYGAYDDNLVVLEIVMGYNPPPRGDSIYDARRLLDQLRDYRY